jgi:hypothetical protein
VEGLAWFAIGCVLLWIGYRSWRLRNTEAISVIEAAVLKATGEEPLPRTGTDKALAYFQAAMGFLLGPFFIAIGIASLLA